MRLKLADVPHAEALRLFVALALAVVVEFVMAWRHAQP
jgi:hypothetical protein